MNPLVERINTSEYIYQSCYLIVIPPYFMFTWMFSLILKLLPNQSHIHVLQYFTKSRNLAELAVKTRPSILFVSFLTASTCHRLMTGSACFIPFVAVAINQTGTHACRNPKEAFFLFCGKSGAIDRLPTSTPVIIKSKKNGIPYMYG